MRRLYTSFQELNGLLDIGSTGLGSTVRETFCVSNLPLLRHRKYGRGGLISDSGRFIRGGMVSNQGTDVKVTIRVPTLTCCESKSVYIVDHELR